MCNQFPPQIIICVQKSGVNTNRIGNFFICQVYFPKYHPSRQVFRTTFNPSKKNKLFLLDYLLPLDNKGCFCMYFLSYAINDLYTWYKDLHCLRNGANVGM